MSINATSKSGLRKKRRDLDVNTQRRLQTLREILRDPNTRRYIWWLLDQTHPLSDPRQANHTKLHDTHLTAAFAAEQSIGLLIVDDVIAAEPQLFTDYLENQDPRHRWLEPDEGWAEEPEGEDDG